MKKAYRHSYHAPREEDEALAPFKVRDGAAFDEVMAILVSRKSLGYGGLLLNYPASYQITDQSLKLLGWEHVDESTIRKLEVLITQPAKPKAEFLTTVRGKIGRFETEYHERSILDHAMVEVAVDMSFLDSSDCLVQTTRPFLDDAEGHKPGERSNTSLEKKVFKVLRQYLQVCSRSEVCLSAQMANELERSALAGC